MRKLLLLNRIQFNKRVNNTHCSVTLGAATPITFASPWIGVKRFHTYAKLGLFRRVVEDSGQSITDLTDVESLSKYFLIHWGRTEMTSLLAPTTFQHGILV